MAQFVPRCFHFFVPHLRCKASRAKALGLASKMESQSYIVKLCSTISLKMR